MIDVSYVPVNEGWRMALYPDQMEQDIIAAVEKETKGLANTQYPTKVKLTGFSPYGIEGMVYAFAKSDLLLSTMTDAVARAIANAEYLEHGGTAARRFCGAVPLLSNPPSWISWQACPSAFQRPAGQFPTIVFFVMRATGDPISAALGGRLTPAELQQRIHAAGYNCTLNILYYTSVFCQVLSYSYLQE